MSTAWSPNWIAQGGGAYGGGIVNPSGSGQVVGQPPPPGSAPDWRTVHAQPYYTPIATPDPYSAPLTTAFQDAPRHTTLTGTNILFDNDLFGRPPEHGGAKLHSTFVGPRGRLIAVYLDPRNNTLFYTGGPPQRYG